MSASRSYFVTRWQVTATRDEVAAILDEPVALRRAMRRGEDSLIAELTRRRG